MPDVAITNLHSWCVVWQKYDTNNRYGQPRVQRPVEMRCRWNDSLSDNVTQDSTTESVPMSVLVAKHVNLGSYVWGPGKVADMHSVPVYYEVVGVHKVLDLKGRHPAYRIMLQKASKTLPEVVGS